MFGKGPLSILAIFSVKMTKKECEKLDASLKLASSCAKIIKYRGSVIIHYSPTFLALPSKKSFNRCLASGASWAMAAMSDSIIKPPS
jgi:hypothetical protein